MNRTRITGLMVLALTISATLFNASAAPASADGGELRVYEPETRHALQAADSFVWGCALFEQITYDCEPDWKP